MFDKKIKDQFDENGFLVIKNFYSPDECSYVQNQIRQIIKITSQKYKVDIGEPDGDHALGVAINRLASVNRNYVSEIYDAVKQLPSFQALVNSQRNIDLFTQIRPGSMPGIAAGGSGIRIDLPKEDKFRAAWHQEFPAQLRSLDGIVFWSPIEKINADMGPVEIAEGSHKGGYIDVLQTSTKDANQSGAYSLRLKDEKKVLQNYTKSAPLTNPGDLIVMDYLTLHQSGENRSRQARLSMQFRYFNFLDPLGIDIAWKGSSANQNDINEILSFMNRTALQ